MGLKCAQKTELAPNSAARHEGALTKILVSQTSVAGYVDKEDIFACILLKRNVFLPVDGEGSILVDGTTHTAMAVCLEEKKVDTGELLEWTHLGNRTFLHLLEMDDSQQGEKCLTQDNKNWNWTKTEVSQFLISRN